MLTKRTDDDIDVMWREITTGDGLPARPVLLSVSKPRKKRVQQ